MAIEKQMNLLRIGVNEEDAEEFMRSYLTSGNPQLRATRSIRQDDRRFLVYENGSSLEAIEEKGDWSEHGFVAVPDNDYYCLEENGKEVEREEISWEQAETCLM